MKKYTTIAALLAAGITCVNAETVLLDSFSFDEGSLTSTGGKAFSIQSATVAAGTDGLIIEVHNDPARARCDGPQSLTMEAFDNLMKVLTRFHELTRECRIR